MKTPLTHISKWLLMALFSINLLACGNESEAPLGSTIIANPSSLDISDSAYVIATFGATCGTTYPPAYWDLQPIRISLYDSENRPLGKTEFSVNLTWSGSTTTAGETAWIFDDDIGDGNQGITDAGGALQDNELVSAIGDPALYTTETNSQGYKDLYLLMDAACVWTGQLDIVSGPVGEQVEITKG